MNIMNKLKSKSIGYYLAVLASIAAIVGLIVYFIYTGQGGEKNTWIIVSVIVGVLIDIALFFYDGKYGDIAAVIPPVLFVIALGLSASGGVLNITDDITGVDSFGIARIAKYNYAMIGIFAVGVVLSIVACFLPREKKK